MLLKLYNNNKNLSVSFRNHQEYKMFYGNDNYDRCYVDYVNETLIFKAANFFGFYNNNPIVPYSIRGAQEDGTNFKSNYFASKVVSWTFTNVFAKTSAISSPNNILSALLMEPDDTLTLEVITNNGTFKQEFFVTANTSTEEGAIELETANGDDIYWYVEQIYSRYFFFAQNGDNSVYRVPLSLPKVIVDTPEYPYIDDIFSTGDTDVVYFFGGDTTGVWESITFTNYANNKTTTYNNTDNDTYITIDTGEGTIRNELNQDRSSNLVGSIDNLILVNGLNQLKIVVNNENNYLDAGRDLPLDFRYEVRVNAKFPSIE